MYFDEQILFGLSRMIQIHLGSQPLNLLSGELPRFVSHGLIKRCS